MSKGAEITLETDSSASSERMLAIVAIGLLHSIELAGVSVDEAHSHLFNPYTLEAVRSLNPESPLIDLLHRSLFLEDLESLFSRDKVVATAVELKQKALDILMNSQFDPYEENKWVKVMLTECDQEAPSKQS